MTTAVVTGASSGIGHAVVEALAGAGMTVHAIARREDRLRALAEATGCHTLALDITDPDGLAELMGTLSPDILVLNAGRGAGFGGLAHTSRADLAAAVDINVTALLDMIRLALPGMIAARRGHIVTLGSVSGLYSSVSSVYGGTKAAVKMIAENLRLETRGTGIRVTDIRPGRVTSEFYDVALPEAAAARAKDTRIRELAPGDIAAAILYAVTAPGHVNVSAIELQPLEQTYGGTSFHPL